MNPRKLTGLTPTADLSAQCELCHGTGWVTEMYAAEGHCDDPDHDRHFGEAPGQRHCPDCGGQGWHQFGG